MTACLVCLHRERNAIETALVRGSTIASVCKTFRIQHMVVNRHKTKCMNKIMKLGVPLVHTEEKVNLHNAYTRVMQESARLGGMAEDEGDLRTALLGVREYARGAELVQKMQESSPSSTSIERDPMG